MKTVKISMPLVLALVLYTAFSYAAYAESGSDKYTPTKLEWLITYLNLNATSLVENYKGCLVSYELKPPNTINVRVIYGFKRCASKTEANDTLRFAKMHIADFALKKKWEEWVEVQGELKEIHQAHQQATEEAWQMLKKVQQEPSTQNVMISKNLIKLLE